MISYEIVWNLRKRTYVVCEGEQACLFQVDERYGGNIKGFYNRVQFKRFISRFDLKVVKFKNTKGFLIYFRAYKDFRRFWSSFMFCLEGRQL